MPIRFKTSPRKLPTQERSKAVVDALMGATASLLSKTGYEGLNTNHVADEAGVSVGSLYQYFPNKAALVNALMERWADATMNEARKAFTALESESLEVGIHHMVELILGASREHPILHRALYQLVHRIGATEQLEQLNRRFEALLAVWLEGRAHQLEVDDIPLAAHLVFRTLVALTDHALVHRPERLKSAKYAAELERVALAQLAPSRVKKAKK